MLTFAQGSREERSSLAARIRLGLANSLLVESRSSFVSATGEQSELLCCALGMALVGRRTNASKVVREFRQAEIRYGRGSAAMAGLLEIDEGLASAVSTRHVVAGGSSASEIADALEAS